MQRVFHGGVAVALWLCTVTAWAAEANPTWKPRLMASDPSTWKAVPFQASSPGHGVTLDDKGLFKPAMEKNIRYLLKSFSVNHMLAPFRKRAGQPIPPVGPQDGAHHGFWDDQLRGSNAGRFLMGAGNTLRWIEHAELRRRTDELIDGIEACRGPDGYLLAYPPGRPVCEEPNYARAWLTHGLIEAGIAGNKKAFPLLRGHADWFNQWDLLPKLLYWNNNNHQGHIASTRTYFSPVGKPEDLQVAEKYYVCDWWLDQLAARQEEAVWKYPLASPHSYLITSFEAYLDHYRATGDKRFLDAMLAAWGLIHDKWEHVGGSMAICEGNPYPPSSYFVAKQCTGETCGSVFWIKFNQRFHQLFPMDEKYVGEIEKSIYNVCLANQLENGCINYHARLQGNRPDGGFYAANFNTCCAGQGTRLLGSLPEYIYSTAKDGLYVNLFEPSTIAFEVAGRPVRLTAASRFPFQPEVELRVSTSQPVAMKLRVRAPGWAGKDVPIQVNGRQEALGKPGSYAILDRTWADGDRVSFTLPMDFRVTRYTGLEQFPGHERWAMEYGPILLAVDGLQGREIPVKIAHDPNKPRDWLIPKPDQPLHFSILGDSEHGVVPYWLTKAWTCTCFPVIDRLAVRGADRFLTNATVQIVSYVDPAAEIRYTADGGEPTLESLRYTGPFPLQRTTTVKARAFSNGQPVLAAAMATFQKVSLFAPAIRPSADFKKIEILPAPLFPQAKLHYTLDGKEPTPQSACYAGPLAMPAEKTVIRARAVVPGEALSTVVSYMAGGDGNPWPLPDVYLSDLQPVKATTGGWGPPVQKDGFYGGGGKPLRFLGKEYKKGMGVHAPSELVYEVRPEYKRFVALVGLDSNTSTFGSVVFEIYADEQPVAQTPVLRPRQAWHFDLPIPPGTQRLRLVVADGGDGHGFDQGDWLDAGFVTSPGRTDSSATLWVVAPSEPPAPGREAAFGVAGIPEASFQGKPQTVPFEVYLPANHNPRRKWPVVMEWHGAGGQAGVPISRRVTGGKDFICVGLTYINGQAETEDKYIKRVYDTVIERFNGDERAVFPGGFSLGGLAQERFVLRPETIGRYRAVWMFGAGLVGSHFRKPAEVTWLAKTPFFIAVGETDFNRKAVETASPHFKAVIPDLALHVMPGKGHQVDFESFGPKLLEFWKRNLPAAAPKEHPSP